MQITITGKHFTPTDAIKNYLLKRIAKIERYFKRENDWVHAILTSERENYIVELTLGGGNAALYADTNTPDMYASIDEAVHKITKQIKKHKEKIKTEKRRTARLSSVEHKSRMLSEGVFSAEAADGMPADVIRRNMPISKPMGIEEAKAQLNLSGNIFMPFYNSKTERINIIFKQKDGKYGLIEP